MTASDGLPLLCVDVVEPGTASRSGWLRCEIGTALRFDTARMQTYFFKHWESVLYDALLVSAAVEYCDRVRRRPSFTWGRDIQLRVPVHEPDLWEKPEVHQSLHNALDLLTGDRWRISFRSRRRPEPCPPQILMDLSSDVSAVLPFSDGLDSHAVAALLSGTMGDRLVRVRLGSATGGLDPTSARVPFVAVPYAVRLERSQSVESSARSRGFKFAVLSGLAARLSGAARIVVPESGQGALGSTLVPVGQSYPDYRNHPVFAAGMERFLVALLGHKLAFEFPQLWFTKGETLVQYARSGTKNGGWAGTRSCWQQSRQVGVAGSRRQCGICAACLLRRMSLHAAGLTESGAAYVWENLGADRFDSGVATAFDRGRITTAMREYAIAGALHCDHLARLRHSPANSAVVDACVDELASSFGLTAAEVRTRLVRLLTQHEAEWKGFLSSLGPGSFLAEWVCEA